MKKRGIDNKRGTPTGRVKRTFSKQDDENLIKAVQSCKFADWNEISKKLGKWSPRQCRERWKNYVDPSLSHEKWTEKEDETLLKRFDEIGTNWIRLKTFLPGRSVNGIKNRLQFLRSHNSSTTQSVTDIEETVDLSIVYYLDFLKISNLVNVH